LQSKAAPSLHMVMLVLLQEVLQLNHKPKTNTFSSCQDLAWGWSRLTCPSPRLPDRWLVSQSSVTYPI